VNEVFSEKHMAVLQAIWRFWRQQNDAARLCLATALGAFFVDGIGVIANLFSPKSTTTGGLSAVGLFYILLALGSINWRSSEAPKDLTVHWHFPETLPVLSSDQTTAKPGDDQLRP
jgi:hypothetical protein